MAGRLAPRVLSAFDLFHPMFQPDIIGFWITRRRYQDRKKLSSDFILDQPVEKKAVTTSAGGLKDNMGRCLKEMLATEVFQVGMSCFQ